MIEPRVITDMPFDDYLNADGVSKHDLDLVSLSGAHYKWGKEHPKPPTESMKIGSLTHTAVFEPSKFHSSYFIQPLNYIDPDTKEKQPWNPRKKYCRQWKAAAQSERKPILAEETIDKINSIAEAVGNHPAAAQLLNGLLSVEVSVFVEIDGVLRKSRIDGVGANSYLVDLKTSKNASPEGFKKDIANFRYHVQAAYYLDNADAAGISRDFFYFIAVENEPPFNVGVYEMSEDDIACSREEYKQDLETFKQCSRFQHWGGYSQEIVTLNLPPWAYRATA